MDFISPKKILTLLQKREKIIFSGSTVVDFGAGSGVYATLLMPLVEETGSLYVVDVHKELLKRLQDDISSPVLKPVWADIERPLSSGLPNESVDFVLFSNVLFQLEKKEIAIDEAHRILKKGGFFLVVDWDGETNTPLIKKDLTTKLSFLKDLFVQKSFLLKGDLEAGDHHFAFIGTKQ